MLKFVVDSPVTGRDYYKCVMPLGMAQLFIGASMHGGTCVAVQEMDRAIPDNKAAYHLLKGNKPKATRVGENLCAVTTRSKGVVVRAIEPPKVINSVKHSSWVKTGGALVAVTSSDIVPDPYEVRKARAVALYRPPEPVKGINLVNVRKYQQLAAPLHPWWEDSGLYTSEKLEAAVMARGIVWRKYTLTELRSGSSELYGDVNLVNGYKSIKARTYVLTELRQGSEELYTPVNLVNEQEKNARSSTLTWLMRLGAA